MRYLGLVFLGLVLWVGQALADEVSDKLALRVITEGKNIGENYYGEFSKAQQMSLVVYKGDFYICMDFLAGQPLQMPDMDVLVSCWRND